MSAQTKPVGVVFIILLSIGRSHIGLKNYSLKMLSKSCSCAKLGELQCESYY